MTRPTGPDQLHLAVALEWRAAGVSGLRLRPAVLPHDLDAVAAGLVPELQQRDAFRSQPDGMSLRARLGLGRAANRYAHPGRSAE